jgi:hypothetical protein
LNSLDHDGSGDWHDNGIGHDQAGDHRRDHAPGW